MSNDPVRELVDILARLRAPEGCPWDREQTHETLKRFLVEETGELLDAIDEDDDQAMLDELGDVLLQIVFHCQIAREQGRFDIDDVARSECRKMVRRHPHVFAEADAETPEEVVDRWDEIKNREKPERARDSAVSGVPRHLPALHRAEKIQRQAAKTGFEWTSVDQILEKIREELREVEEALGERDEEALTEEIGDLLFAVVCLTRYRRLHAEEILHAAVRKFETRFRAMEARLAEQSRRIEDCDTAELEARWRDTGDTPSVADV